MLGGASEHDYRRALEAVLDDEENDGVLIILAPQAVVDPAAVVHALATVSAIHPSGKPLAVCLMGEASLGAAFAAAHAHRLPAYTFPDEAVAAFGVLYQRARWLATAHRCPSRPAGMNLQHARSVLGAATRAATTTRGRHALGQALDAMQGRAIAQAAGLAVPADELATSPEEAAVFAQRIGFPVALKLVSPDITHKTDVGCVLLGIQDATAAREGFHTLAQRALAAHPHAAIRGAQVQRMIGGGQEVIVGMKRDATLGPLVMFGMGGIYAEALADVAFRLAPLSPADAEEMIAEVRSARLLTGLRGACPADRGALVDALLRVGWLAHSCPRVRELDINPLMVLPQGKGVLAVDVRLVVR
jgi:acetyltransferase